MTSFASRACLLACTALVSAGLGWIARAWLHLPDPQTTALVAVPSSPRPLPRSLPTSEATTPAQATEAMEAAAATVANLRRQLSERETELNLVTERAHSANRMLDAMFSEIRQRARENAGTSASVFQSIDEAGIFVAAINQRFRDLNGDFPEAPAVGTPARADYDRRHDAILQDAAMLVQDPLLLGEVFSGDPVRISQAQASYLSADLGLAATDAARMTETLRQAYVEGFARKLSMDHRPDSPAELAAWQSARDELNARTVTALQAALPPDKSERLSGYGYDYVVFNLTVGGLNSSAQLPQPRD